MEKQESKPLPACPLCGGTTFIDGSLTNPIFEGGPFFHPNKSDKTSQVMPRPTIIKALACQACGYILLFRTTRS